MSEVKTYKKGEFSQINLDDGTKVMISIGFSDVRVFKLGFMGLPKETIWSAEREDEIIYKEELLDKIVEKIKEIASLSELENFFKSIKEKGLEGRLLDFGIL